MNGAHFSFTTTAFVDSAEAVAERVNAEIGGHALATWLAGALREAGIQAGEPWVEDHGWDFDIRDGTRLYLCACAIEEDGAASREGHVSVDLHRSMADRLLGRNTLAPDDRVVGRVREILGSAPGIARLAKD
jgi:hypothetical protein